jgi:surface polysaccharide O-acyltransferase-like enzyme
MRYFWLDYVRATACLMVVVLHVSAFFVIKMPVDSSAWYIGNIFNSITRICVPLFFLMTGYLLFREKSPTSKNIIRVFAALIFYSIFAIFVSSFSHSSIGINSLIALPFKPVFYHLWYFYAIIPIYILGMVVTVRNVSNLTVFICFTFIMIFFNNSFTSLLNLPSFKFEGFGSNKNFDYILYAFLGAFLGSVEFSKKWMTWACFFIFCACSALNWYFTLTETLNSGEYITKYHSYKHVFVIGAACALFLFFKTVPFTRSSVPSYVKSISKYSLPIYGFHAPILKALESKGFLLMFDSALVAIVVTTFIVIGSSFLLGVGLKVLDKNSYVS